MGNKWLSPIINIIALTMALFHILYLYYPIVPYSRFTIIHVTFALGLSLLTKIKKAVHFSAKCLQTLLLLAGVAILFYIYSQAVRLELGFGMGLPLFDFWMGLILLGIFLIATYLSWGIAIPIIMAISISYIFFGSHIPGALGFPALSNEDIMTFLVMGISTGIFGYLIPVSANLIFYFMLFGGILGAVGVLPMFLEAGKWLGNHFRGGAALTSIIGSGLVGTVTGSTMANIALTGAYTIPTMKKQGFTPQSAAAIEQVASSGGQIMPPLMGAGAFLMAVILDIPYWSIALIAVLPALIYYGISFVGVALLVRHYDIRKVPQTVDMSLLMSRIPLFLIPLIILIFTLAKGISAGKAIIITLFFTTALAILYAILGRLGLKPFCSGPQPSVKEYFRGMAKGAIEGAELAISVVAIAVIAQVAITTGVGPKLGHALVNFTFGFVPLALILIMICCLLLGMGVPTVAAYSIVAIMMVPTITMDLGIASLPAHFFTFYYAVFAAITPPVAPGALVASRIANCSFWSAGLHGFRLALPLFLLPFGWIREPELLRFPHIGFGAVWMSLVMLLSGLSIGIVSYRHFIIKLNIVEWLLASAALIPILIYIIFLDNVWLMLIYLALLAILSISQWQRWRQRGKVSLTGVQTPSEQLLF